MKLRNFFSFIFACIFAAVASLAVFCCVRFVNAGPILLAVPAQARSQAVAVMDAVCGGDFDAASGNMLGNPDLGMDAAVEGDVARLLWDAYLGSMSYELVGEAYATEKGVAQKVAFTSLSLDSVTADLNQRSRTLLEQRMQEAEDTADIYDENNEYREDFVMSVLYDAAVAALAENGELVTRELTIELQYQDGRWWVVADKLLLDELFGGIL